MNTPYLIFFSPGGRGGGLLVNKKKRWKRRVCFARISNINRLNKQQRLKRVGAKSGCKRDRPTRFRIFPSPFLPSQISSPLPSRIDQKYCQILYFQLHRVNRDYFSHALNNPFICKSVGIKSRRVGKNSKIDWTVCAIDGFSNLPPVKQTPDPKW